MTTGNDRNLPPEIKSLLKRECLEGLRDGSTLNTYELELFAWYLHETDSLTQRMQQEELHYVREQSDAGDPEPNDSGLVAAAYYSRRARYSHVIYLASLLEASMKRECQRLIAAIGEHNVPFRAADLRGDPWTRKRKFLEGYGDFKIPSSTWTPVQKLLNVRNVLVHDNGSTESMKEDQISALAKIPGITIFAGEVEVGPEYLLGAFQAVKGLVSFLHEKVSVVIDQEIKPRLVR
ncbi:MAG: hypothetical protein ACHQ4J_15100 [Candidatus Binatia bacterium]